MPRARPMACSRPSLRWVPALAWDSVCRAHSSWQIPVPPSHPCHHGHGDFLDRNGASASYQNDPDLRDDRRFQSGITDALGFFRGDGRSHIDGQFANLRLHERSHHRRGKANVMADRLEALSFKGLPSFSLSCAARKDEKVPTTNDPGDCLKQQHPMPWD